MLVSFLRPFTLIFTPLGSRSVSLQSVVFRKLLFNNPAFVIYLRNEQSSKVAQQLQRGGATVRTLNWKDQISFYGKLIHGRKKTEAQWKSRLISAGKRGRKIDARSFLL